MEISKNRKIAILILETIGFQDEIEEPTEESSEAWFEAEDKITDILDDKF